MSPRLTCRQPSGGGLPCLGGGPAGKMLLDVRLNFAVLPGGANSRRCTIRRSQCEIAAHYLWTVDSSARTLATPCWRTPHLSTPFRWESRDTDKPAGACYHAALSSVCRASTSWFANLAVVAVTRTVVQGGAVGRRAPAFVVGKCIWLFQFVGSALGLQTEGCPGPPLQNGSFRPQPAAMRYFLCSMHFLTNRYPHCGCTERQR
jgi:hypothetical protein